MSPEFPKKHQLRKLGLLDAVLQLQFLCCTLWLNDRFQSRGVCVCVGGGGGWSSARFTNGKIEDHRSDGYKIFVFPSHENKQVRHTF